MTKEQISELAKAIANEDIIINWHFYVLIILLSFIGSYAGNFINSYAKKRGENLATKADINEIKAQLTSTTEITEKIKNDIEHQVWRKQQIETIKRNKLEEYLQYIYIAQEDLSKDMNNKYFKTNEPIDIHAMSKATMLQKLYFPELKKTHSQLLHTHGSFKSWMVEGMQELIEKQNAGEQTPIISKEHMKKYPTLLTELNEKTTLVETKAEVMSEELNVS
ncbi:MAG: hypothetical protein RBR59_07415 [Sulfurimonadaceae bacterium]|jgi:hypothetical protein|nr:hypothetical protein [Sulfurimonadaceae bacterium]